MLSLAYGEVQQGATQLHRPEACYSSQGFTLQSVGPDLLTVGARKLDVFRMTAMIGRRIEQVTYWIRMGDRLIAGSSFNLNLTRMEMGLKGIIADGLLFRVSEISPNATASKQLQDQFVRDLLFTVSPAQQATLIGKPIASLDRQNH
jgi:EpsI family protein